jgi:hypothetical protein
VDWHRDIGPSLVVAGCLDIGPVGLSELRRLSQRTFWQRIGPTPRVESPTPTSNQLAMACPLASPPRRKLPMPSGVEQPHSRQAQLLVDQSPPITTRSRVYPRLDRSRTTVATSAVTTKIAMAMQNSHDSNSFVERMDSFAHLMATAEASKTQP